MLYLYINKNTVKVIYLKKTILGQQETTFFEKKYEADILPNGKVSSTDLLASAIKEILSMTPNKPVADNQVFLILPQQSFEFCRTEVPTDIAPAALSSFVKDKASSSFTIPPDQCLTDIYTKSSTTGKTVSIFGLPKTEYEKLYQAFSLIDMRITSIIPDTLTYFKLFDKTLRDEKKETILYLTVSDKQVTGYYYDSYGLINPTLLEGQIKDEEKVESVVKKIVTELTQDGQKLNRIILSGELSDKIRQDTFTKAVGAWTNPLKRIVPNFYDLYIKQLIVEEKKVFPLLSFDVCFGSFIFEQEEKNFSLLKNRGRITTINQSKPFTLPSINLPMKEILLFIGSFALSFIAFMVFSKTKLPNINIGQPKATPTIAPSSTPSPSPTPAYKKEELKLKVLNGSGTKGKANEVKEILKNKGYSEIITGNADNFDYTKTEVQIKKEYEDVLTTLKTDVKDYVSDLKSSELEKDSTADIILIIGQDFK